MDLCFLIPSVIAQIFNPAAELVSAIGIRAKEARAEIEIEPPKVEAQISKCSI